MRHSLESLATFAEAASAGSFSAAARKLGKSRSTVNETIANLEVDLNLRLFDRRQRQPVLTEQGQVMLELALHVLAANDRLNRLASQLFVGLEARLTVALCPILINLKPLKIPWRKSTAAILSCSWNALLPNTTT
jgi:DNA-binding transcriptional LysR family regulator